MLPKKGNVFPGTVITGTVGGHRTSKCAGTRGCDAGDPAGHFALAR